MDANSINNILRKIPKIDSLLEQIQGENGAKEFSYQIILDACRQTLDTLRQNISDGKITQIPDIKEITGLVLDKAKALNLYSLRPVINATGVVLHTNLGRSVLAEKAAQHVKNVATSYSTLEYDLDCGERGSRHTHVESLICALTGAEAAMVVNNNAAAVMLALMCVRDFRDIEDEKEVVVSRGELVEIGGSFRVPEIMRLSGTTLYEVGTTNKTKLADYENAVNFCTAALLKVHTSNFKIIGFSESVEIKQLSVLAKQHGVPLIFDLGSGLLFDNNHAGLSGETSVSSSIKDGADIVCFSGDKLLGGPQAGIIAGRKDLISAMKKNQFARVVRIDKLSLAALEATLKIYLDPKAAEKEIPVLSDITASQDELKRKAKKLCRMLKAKNLKIKAVVKQSDGQVGGGSAPGEDLPSYVVEINSETKSAVEIEKLLREFETPIIARIHKGSVLIDVRTVREREFGEIVKALNF